MTPPDGYLAHDRFTDPGEYAAQLAALPHDLSALHAAINGVLIHVWKIRAFHPQLLDPNRHDVFTRHACTLLEHIAERGANAWTTERPVERRSIVDCRQFALLLCAVLRERGIPARTRCGFATYLEETHYQDHWVCEYWDAAARRWVMEDVDLHKHDVAPHAFITGARAWQLCRADPALAARFGYGVDAGLRGRWAVRMDAVHDLAALNNFVCVSGDAWGLAVKDEETLTADDLAVLDQAAAYALHDAELAQLRHAYESHEGLRAPAEIGHFDYVKDAFSTVAWAQQP